MLKNRRVSAGGLLLALFILPLPPLALAKDLSALQTALQMSLNEMKAAEAERDADAQQAAKTEKEVVRLKEQLEAQRKKSAQSETRYIESKKRYNKAQDNLDQAWKK